MVIGEREFSLRKNSGSVVHQETAAVGLRLHLAKGRHTLLSAAGTGTEDALLHFASFTRYGVGPSRRGKCRIGPLYADRGQSFACRGPVFLRPLLFKSVFAPLRLCVRFSRSSEIQNTQSRKRCRAMS